MCIVEFRFSDGIPSREGLRSDLQHELGPRGDDRFDSIEMNGDRVRALGQDLIALLYFAKVCQERGGVAVPPGRDEPGRIPIPEWAQVPWTEHGVLQRIAIRLGRISLARVSLDE
jgi:hypothetical protein